MLLCEKEGNNVCTQCGVVQQPRGINVQNSFDPNMFDPPVQHQRRIPGVSDAVMGQVAAQDKETEQRHSSYWEDLQHWNVFGALSDDVLSEADQLLSMWKGGGHSRPVRLISTMIYMKLKDKLPNEDALRQRIRNQQPLNAISLTAPPAPFPCTNPNCSKRFYSRKEARMHCKQHSRTRTHTGKTQLCESMF